MASEDQLQTIIDCIPGLVNTATATGEVELVNRRILEYLGKTIEEFTSWSTNDAVHPDDLPRVIAAWRHSIETGRPHDLDHRLRGADGVYRWFNLSSSPQRDAEGRIIRWYTLLTKIDEHIQVEEKLRRSEAFLLEAQRLSHTGSWKHDLSSNVVRCSPEMLRVFDVQPSENSSVPEFWLNRIHPEDRKRVQEAFQRSKIEKTDYQAEYRIVLPNGTIKYQLSIGYPILNECGDLVEFVGTAMDVTEQGLARAELEKALEEINRLTDCLRAENLALRASEHELSLIVETIPGNVWCASANGELTYVNQRELDYIGTTLEPLAQVGWLDFLHPDDVQPTVR